ncbi:MAG TPA: phosphate-starvation-inducible protein PsiE, partial [Pseudomonas sp.]|nr:phosphate-starvation-inducible protein PsiE [Pseudomonas sp.]
AVQSDSGLSRHRRERDQGAETLD